jgi:hypothetical protein
MTCFELKNCVLFIVWYIFILINIDKNGGILPFSLQGSTINTFGLKNKMFPLIFAGDIPNTAGGYNSSVSRYRESI